MLCVRKMIEAATDLQLSALEERSAAVDCIPTMMQLPVTAAFHISILSASAE